MIILTRIVGLLHHFVGRHVFHATKIDGQVAWIIEWPSKISQVRRIWSGNELVMLLLLTLAVGFLRLFGAILISIYNIWTT